MHVPCSRRSGRLRLIAAAALLLFCAPASALSLDSYIYTDPETARPIPAPYAVADTEGYADLGGLKDPQDIDVGADGRRYIADTGNDRVLIVDADGKLVSEVREYPADGQTVRLHQPAGVCAAPSGELYVADTGNGRIAVFSADGVFSRLIEAPQGDTLRDGFLYQPRRIAVSAAGYVYAVGAGMVEGLAEFDDRGQFVRFAASNATTPDPLTYFWTRTFASQTQKDISALFLSEEFNSVVLDGEGYFLTVSTTAGVRRFNTKGGDITKSGGHFAPVGDYRTTETAGAASDLLQENDGDGISKLIDISAGPDGLYTVIDAVYQRVFAYDDEGNMLWAFGVQADLKGGARKAAAVCYDQNGDLLLLDSELGRVTRFTLTPFGEAASLGARLRFQGKNDEAAEAWASIRAYDEGYPLAYRGQGILCYRAGDYRGAMRYYRLADDTQGYSKAFVKYRRTQTDRFFAPVMSGLLVLAAAWAVAARLRRRRARAPRKNGYADSSALSLPRQIGYARYAAVHPFKAFLDMKVYRKAGVISASVWLILLALANTLRAQSSGFLFLPSGAQDTALLGQLFTVFAAALLFCGANWGLTTLMDGEGTFRQIYVMTGYVTVPLTVSQLLTWALSHVLSAEEGAVLSVIAAAGVLYAGLLLFVGTVTTHQYTAAKNVAALLLTVVAIAAMLFLAMIAVEMTDWVITFVKTLGREIALAAG